ncbi:MAG: sigma-70 family RNA polymerase sigma factor [Planctomycetota bacterium]
MDSDAGPDGRDPKGSDLGDGPVAEATDVDGVNVGVYAAAAVAVDAEAEVEVDADADADDVSRDGRSGELPADATSNAGFADAEAAPNWDGERRRQYRPRVEPALVEGLWGAYFEAPGDQTRNRLVEAYQVLAKDIARRFGARLPRSVDRGDLLTAASVGLISAVEGFDPERGVRFESYCELRVKGALLDELRSQDWLPRPWRQRVEQQKRASEKLRSMLGRPPADEEVATEMGLGIDVYQQTFGVGLPGAPLGSMPNEESDEDGGPALDVVADTSTEAPGERLSREELLTLVSQKLSEQESRIVYLKYWEELPMREIGELTGLSESRVCKIHTRLIERLQDRFRVHIDGD